MPGKEGRPLIWNSSTCFAFPGAAANRRGDLGLVFHYGSGTDKNPSVAYAMADNFEKAPPGWRFHSVGLSRARPSDNKWGAYNRTRAFEPSRKVWVGASHFLPTTNGDCCSAPPRCISFSGANGTITAGTGGKENRIVTLLGDIGATVVGCHGFELRRPNGMMVARSPSPGQLSGLTGHGDRRPIRMGKRLETRIASIAFHTRGEPSGAAQKLEEKLLTSGSFWPRSMILRSENSTEV